MFDVTELPAVRRSEAEFLALAPIEEPKVGDRVVIWTRGAYREALIEKVGRTNITCVYTTEGALKDAHKAAGWRTPDRLREDAERTRAHFAEANVELRSDTLDYLDRLAELAKRVEELPAGRRWEAFVTETRKSVPFDHARAADMSLYTA